MDRKGRGRHLNRKRKSLNFKFLGKLFPPGQNYDYGIGFFERKILILYNLLITAYCPFHLKNTKNFYN